MFDAGPMITFEITSQTTYIGQYFLLCVLDSMECNVPRGGKVADADLTDEAESHGLKRKYSRLDLPA